MLLLLLLVPDIPIPEAVAVPLALLPVPLTELLELLLLLWRPGLAALLLTLPSIDDVVGEDGDDDAEEEEE